jgi:hypothetical protein
MSVGAGADDGEVAALHAGDGGHLCDACGKWEGLHTGQIYAFAYTNATKKNANPRNSQPLKKPVVHPIRERQAVPSPFPDPNQTVIRLTLKHHCHLTILTRPLCLIATLRFLTGREVFRTSATSATLSRDTG